MEDFVTGVLQSSFSIAVAGYLLVRMEARLYELCGAISRLEGAIERVCGRERPGGPGVPGRLS